MDKEGDQNQNKTMRSLRREWAFYVTFSLIFLGAGFITLSQGWDENYALRWLIVAAAISGYQFWFIYRNLGDNRLSSGGEPFPSLGLANWITLTRAVFNAALAGFLIGPWPAGWLSWAPSALYLTSAVMDYMDGFVARVTGRTTVLGEVLDMKWDGAGALAAGTLSVLYGQTPYPFLLVGLARYLFLFGTWVRERNGQPMYELPPNRFRRPFAGMMMGFLAVVLMPVYQPPPTLVAAWLFMLPFLVNFFRDWLFVSGALRQEPSSGQGKPVAQRGVWRVYFPLVIRVTLVSILLELLFHVLRQKPFDAGLLLVLGFAIPALSLGAAGRVFSLVVLLMAGFGLQTYPFEWRFWVILLLGIISMMVGSGRYSIWKPEDWLMYKHAGEGRQAAKTTR